MNPLGSFTPINAQSIARGFAAIGAALRDAAAGISAWASNGIQHVRRMISERTAAPAPAAVDPRRSVAGVELADFSRSAPLDALVRAMPKVEPNRPSPTLEQVKTAVHAWLAARDAAGQSGLARLLGPELRPALRAAKEQGGLEAVVALLTSEGGIKDQLTDSAMQNSTSMFTGRAFEMLLADACKEPPAPADRGLRTELLTLLAPSPERPSTVKTDDASPEPGAFRRHSTSSGSDEGQVVWRDTKHSMPPRDASSAEPSASSTAGPQSSSLSAAFTEASTPLRDARDALQAWIGQHKGSVAGQQEKIFRTAEGSIPAVAQLVSDQPFAELAQLMLDLVCPLQPDGRRASPTAPSPSAVVNALLQENGSGRSRLAQMLGGDARVVAGELFRALSEHSGQDGTQFWGVYNLIFLRGLGRAIGDVAAFEAQQKDWKALPDPAAEAARQSRRSMAFMQAAATVQTVFRQAVLAGRTPGADPADNDAVSRLRPVLDALLGIEVAPEPS